MKEAPPDISVVSPVYLSEDSVEELVRRLVQELSSLTSHFEILLVEDGSPDNSWDKISECCRQDPRVKGIRLSRNFGQHHAITAGLEKAQGEWVVVMDCDLQDRPEEITSLYHAALEGFDIVIAKRRNRQHGVIKQLFSKLFYRVLSYLTDLPQDSSIANFGIYHRRVIQSVCRMSESIRYFPSMIKWVGFSRKEVFVEHGRRFAGETSYNFKKLMNLALEIILAYSDKPLRLMVKLGLIVSFFSLLFALYNIVRALTGGIEVLGYASLMVSIWFLAGFLIFILGILGLYIGKIFDGVKNRPVYLIKETVNFK